MMKGYYRMDRKNRQNDLKLIKNFYFLKNIKMKTIKTINKLLKENTIYLKLPF